MKTNPNEKVFPEIVTELEGDWVSKSENNSGFATLGNTYGEGGLTKREYFAGLAMQGILSNPSFELLQPGELAIESCRVADVLIEELNKEKK